MNSGQRYLFLENTGQAERKKFSASIAFALIAQETITKDRLFLFKPCKSDLRKSLQ